MCGIAGVVGFEGHNAAAEEAVRLQMGAIARRGPDSAGMERWPDAILGHRRLAILDPSSAGHQPMISEDGRIGVVFNGCIYNFLEIRLELERAGHAFRSYCDTEVLVRGYQEWGIDALVSRLRGMFAFAVWDESTRRLFMVRDRLGVKPLLYSTRGRMLAFASSASALRASGYAGQVNAQAILEFLEFGYIPDHSCAYEGMVKVPAATIVEWRDGKISQRQYWRVPEPDNSCRITFEDAVEETERLLIDSVRLRLYADVPIGALLSGGIDSALVCWAMTKLNANVRAFTVSTPGDPEDESADTVETARILDIPHEIVSLPRRQDGILDELTSAYGEPFGCSSALAMLRLSRAVKPHATVLLTGDGGDDVFLGYPFYRTYLHVEQIARLLPESVAAVWQRVRPLMVGRPSIRRARHLIDYTTGGLGAVARAHNGLPYLEQRDVLGERLRDRQVQQRNIPLSATSARRLLSDVLKYQQGMWFASEFMTKLDGATAYHALEARSPFLDQTLWEFAARLPLGLRLQNGTLKAVLREIVRKRIGPRTANRRKSGFSIPVERWLTNEWSNALHEAMEAPLNLERDGWIRAGAFRQLVTEAKENGPAPVQLWWLIVLEKWLRQPAGRADQDPAPAWGAVVPFD